MRFLKSSLGVLLGSSMLFLFLALTTYSSGIVRAEVEPLSERTMRNITGREGIDFQFNLELGEQFNSRGENMHLVVQDGDGDENSTTDYAWLFLEGIWLTMDVGASQTSDSIKVDALNSGDGDVGGALQLKMEAADEFRGIQGGFDEALIKYNQTGAGGNSIIGLGLGNGSGGSGSLDFTGKLHVFGAPQ